VKRFPADLETVLRAAGWSPNRRVGLDAWRVSLSEFGWHGAAERFLQEFGGLRVAVAGPGVNVARAPFEFDPEGAVGEEERFAELSDVFGRKFFPIGELANGEFFLGIDENGILYRLLGDAAEYGPVDQALEHLFRGIRPTTLEAPHD
jgi:hypothetical protein